MTRSTTLFAAAAVAASLAACGNPDAPEPENEAVTETMPQTPDRSETAADEASAATMTGAATGEAPAAPAAPAAKAQPEPERASGYPG